MLKIQVRIERENKTVSLEVDTNISIKDIIKQFNLNPVEVVSAVNGEIVTDSYKIKDKDNVEFLSVVSGG